LKNRLITIARPQDQPAYICNIEYNKYIVRENEKRKQVNYDFVKIGNEYNIHLDVVRSFYKIIFHKHFPFQ